MTDALLALALAAALRYNLDPALFCRLIDAESRWDVRAVSATGCVGLGQISQTAWNWKPDDPFDPQANLSMAAYILYWNWCYRFDAATDAERWRLAVASYTLGHGEVNRLLETLGTAWETGLSWPVRGYVEEVCDGEGYRGEHGMAGDGTGVAGSGDEQDRPTAADVPGAARAV